MLDDPVSALPHNHAISQSHFIPTGKRACIYIKIFIFCDALPPAQN